MDTSMGIRWKYILRSCVLVLFLAVLANSNESSKEYKTANSLKNGKTNSTLSIIASGIVNTLRRISIGSKAHKKIKTISSRGHGWDDYYDYYPPPPPPVDPFGPMLLMTLIPIMLISSFVPALTMFTANSFGLIQNQGINAIPGNTIATGRRRRKKRSLFATGPYTRHFRTLSEEVIMVILQRLQTALEKHQHLRTARKFI